MKEIQYTGGAKIGIISVTYPFVNLKVDKEKLSLNASIFGNLVFQSSDIVSISLYHENLIIGNGIRIRHRVESYSEDVVFLTFKDPKIIIREIHEIGFLKNEEHQNSDRSIIERQSKGGAPLKKVAVIVSIIIWNLFFLIGSLSLLLEPFKEFQTGFGFLFALGFLFISSLLSLVSSNFRKLILKEGRVLEDIKAFVYFTLIFSGIALISCYKVLFV